MREEIARELYEKASKERDISIDEMKLSKAKSWPWDKLSEKSKDYWRLIADQILTLLIKRVEKSLLTDEEIHLQWVKWRNCQSKLHDEGRDDKQTSYENWLLQAQLDKVLKILEPMERE